MISPNNHVQAPIALAPIHVDAVTGDTLRLLRAILPTTLAITTHFDQACPAILGDAVLLSQIIIKICLNAAQAMQPGTEGRIEVGIAPFFLDENNLTCAACNRAIPAGGHVRLMVCDNDVRMDTRPSRLTLTNSLSTNRAGENAGLDLAGLHDIMAPLHGHITVQREQNRGVSYNVFFPALESTAQEPGQTWMGKGERILLVDDDEELAVVMDKILTRQNYQVRRFNDGLKAWEAFKNTPYAYDLVLTDMTMPGMNGVDLAQRIFAQRPDISVILTTGVNAGIAATRAKKLGFSFLLHKPAGKTDIIKAVYEGLEHKHDQGRPPNTKAEGVERSTRGENNLPTNP